MTPEIPPFHLAFPVTDLEATRRFFVDLLGCRTGREDRRWIDFDLHGHQLTAHLCEQMPSLGTNRVDGKEIPVMHFGLILDWGRWQDTAAALRAAGADFLLEPQIRFRGQPGEQATLFLRDPSGNGIELKAFRSRRQLFATAAE